MKQRSPLMHLTLLSVSQREWWLSSFKGLFLNRSRCDFTWDFNFVSSLQSLACGSHIATRQNTHGRLCHCISPSPSLLISLDSTSTEHFHSCLSKLFSSDCLSCSLCFSWTTFRVAWTLNETRKIGVSCENAVSWTFFFRSNLQKHFEAYSCLFCMTSYKRKLFWTLTSVKLLFFPQYVDGFVG